MISGNSPVRLWFVSALLLGWAAQASDAASCVWKVSSPSGATLYLGGSAHALRSPDYPLPALQSRAGSFFPFGFRDGYANQRSGHQRPGQSWPLSEGRQLEESRRSAHLCLCPALLFFAEYPRAKIQHLPALVDRADSGIAPDGKCPARSRAIPS